MSYIDGFVIPVRSASKQAYRDMTAKVAPVFKENDPRMKMTGDMPFDGQRMIFGGFEVLLDSGEQGR